MGDSFLFFGNSKKKSTKTRNIPLRSTLSSAEAPIIFSTVKNIPLFDRQFRYIIMALLAAVAPHAANLPSPVLLPPLVLWGYVWLASGRGWQMPGRPVLILTAVSALILIMGFYGSLHTDAYVSLLVIMSAFKLMESRTYRDKMFVLFLAYFIVITNLFYTDELGMTLYMFTSVVITTAVLIHLQYPPQKMKENLRFAARLLAQSLPMMIILFFLFPRIQTGFFGLAERGGGKSGFSDRMSPGNISRLAENNDIAFRVRFDGEMPPAHQRYWRGLTFPMFDGRTWSRGIRLPSRPKMASASDPVSYTVTLEPHKARWLFALEMPGTVPRGANMMNDHTLYARRPVTERGLYKVTSHLSYRTGGMIRPDERNALQLPADGNEKARALARSWMRAGMDAEAVAAAALQYFREEGFSYTLEPPLLGRDPVDDFLFSTRQGYCEHYASAFAFLMRAARVPARVVGGYQGGERNPYGDYLIVRQSDAHAWAEIWTPEKGWIRVDPTSAVAPSRLERGLQAVLEETGADSFFSLRRLGELGNFLSALQMGWDSVNTYWNLWVMSYNFQDQTQLLSRLGIRTDSWRWIVKAALLATALIAAFSALIFVRSLRKERIQKDRVERMYDRFCRKMEKIGLPRQPSWGPATYGKVIGEARPDLHEKVSGILDGYIRLRFSRPETGNQRMNGDIREFASSVRSFRPSGQTPDNADASSTGLK